MWLTWANALSASRVVMALIAAGCISREFWLPAGFTFVAAILSDLFDGPLARFRGEASILGGKMDHSADAFFVVVILAALAVQGIVTPLLPFLITVAFLQYVFESGVSKQRPLKASRLGRYNGIAYFIAAGIPITQNAIERSWVSAESIRIGAWVLIASTLVSMITRLRGQHPRVRSLD